MQYDLLIKNGYVVDYASAREGYFDVAVQNGMIAAVESSIGGSAVQELDASGKLVLPGSVSIWLRSNMCGRDIRSAVTILRQQSCSS